MAALVNMSNLLNGKDSRWLQLEVCREYQRNKCTRSDGECKFAHPPTNVEVKNLLHASQSNLINFPSLF